MNLKGDPSHTKPDELEAPGFFAAASPSGNGYLDKLIVPACMSTI